MIHISTKSMALVLTGFALLVINAGAHAQATRTWVSGVGDDVNPCSRTAPCKTFAGAISKTAAKGVISVLDPAGYGALTITKGITIDGGAVNGSVLVSGTNGINIAAGPADVVRLRNITLEGISNSATGIKFNSGGALLLDSVRIHDFSSGHGVHFTPSASSRLVISDSVITNNSGGSGVYVQPGGAGFATVSIDNTKLKNNYIGLEADDRSEVSITNSFISHNGLHGVIAFSSSAPAEIVINESEITNNGLSSASGAGVRSQGALASVVLSDNIISGNPRGLLAAGGGDVVSFGSNRVVSNATDGSPTGVIATR